MGLVRCSNIIGNQTSALEIKKLVKSEYDPETDNLDEVRSVLSGIYIIFMVYISKVEVTGTKHIDAIYEGLIYQTGWFVTCLEKILSLMINNEIKIDREKLHKTMEQSTQKRPLFADSLDTYLTNDSMKIFESFLKTSYPALTEGKYTLRRFLYLAYNSLNEKYYGLFTPDLWGPLIWKLRSFVATKIILVDRPTQQLFLSFLSRSHLLLPCESCIQNVTNDPYMMSLLQSFPALLKTHSGINETSRLESVFHNMVNLSLNKLEVL